MTSDLNMLITRSGVSADRYFMFFAFKWFLLEIFIRNLEFWNLYPKIIMQNIFVNKFFAQHLHLPRNTVQELNNNSIKLLF